MTMATMVDVQGYILRIHDASCQEKGSSRISMSSLKPFVERMIREMFPGDLNTRADLWFQIFPSKNENLHLPRSAPPADPSSQHGSRQDDEIKPPQRLSLLPTAQFRWVTVRLLAGSTRLFEGDYSVDDLFLSAAENTARQLLEVPHITPEDGPWYYTVEPEMDPTAAFLMKSAERESDGVFRIASPEKTRRKFGFKKVSSQPLPVMRLSDFGPLEKKGQGDEGIGRIVLHENVLQGLSGELPFSRNAESGGYLVGRPYRLEESPENEDDEGFSWGVAITDVVPAEQAMADASAFLFTVDTWSRISQSIDTEFRDKKLVGWYHTHLFPAQTREAISGLSSWDQEMHRHFLKKKWQVAILINLDPNDGRQVRCYQRDASNRLVECPFLVMAAGNASPCFL